MFNHSLVDWSATEKATQVWLQITAHTRTKSNKKIIIKFSNEFIPDFSGNNLKIIIIH
jgi:hypothetical protein